jgi:murein peptide amidase A
VDVDQSHNRTAALAGKLSAISARSDFLASKPLRLDGVAPSLLEHFVFEGPHGGGDPIQIGVFAGIHGDEQAGAEALVHLAEELVRDPNRAQGYHLHLYPICNPTGFDSQTRLSASGKDLNREFWRNSGEPEVVLLEREIQRHTFHGLISLHSDDTSNGLYGFVRGAVLARSLLEPALTAAETILPRNSDTIIDGFRAERGIISECYDGILTSPPKLENTPFEIIFETPHSAPTAQQISAFVVAILSILSEYRKFIAFAADL